MTLLAPILFYSSLGFLGNILNELKFQSKYHP